MSRSKPLTSVVGWATLTGVVLCFPAMAAPITIDNVNIDRFGTGYAPSSQTAACGPSAVGAGYDGRDCGLNLVVTNSQPGLTAVPGQAVLGTAQLAERALISFNTFPVGDGNGLNEYGVNVTFDVNGTPLTFNGTATDFVGGAPAFGNPEMIAACSDPNQTAFPQCVNDAALDFRIAFSPPQSLTIGGDQVTLSLASLEFSNNSPINLVLNASVVTQPPTDVPEPASLALLGTGLLGLRLLRRRSTRPHSERPG